MIKKDIIIFGTGPSADVAFQMFEELTDKKIKCFSVDREYIKQKSFNGRPVVAFEDILLQEDRDNVEVFVAIGYGNLSEVRKAKVNQVKDSGFSLTSLIHPKTNLPNDFTHGENCLIMNDVNIHPRVMIGDNNFLWSGATICHHVAVGSHCWFTSGSMIAGNSSVGDNCFFGAASTVTNNISVGNFCFVGAGALVSGDMASGQVIIRKADKIYPLKSVDFLSLIGNKF